MDDSYGGQDMNLTNSNKSRDLESGVILTKFLILGDFQPRVPIKIILIRKKQCTITNFIELKL